MSEDTILMRATFSEKLKLYWLVQGILLLCVTVVGIPLIPIFLLGVGQFFIKKEFDHLEAVLTPRAIKIKRGAYFTKHMTVPLDKITDLSLYEGPLHRALGICKLHVETAGASAAGGLNASSLVGVVNAIEFRNAVMAQRDLVVSGAPSSTPAAQPSGASQDPTLSDIRDTLHRIEKILGNQNSEDA